jgi:hypothetical protein
VEFEKPFLSIKTVDPRGPNQADRSQFAHQLPAPTSPSPSRRTMSRQSFGSRNELQECSRRFNSHMNMNGNPATLVAAHPGNTNAMKYGVYSPRAIQRRADEISARLTASFKFSVAQRIAVEQMARCVAILEAVDRDLDERGLVDKRGQARSLLNHRSRISRQLDHWLSKITPTLDRQSAGESATSAGRSDYVRELQWIGLGNDSSASAHDRVSALRELLKAEAATLPENQTVTLLVHRDDEGNETIDVLNETSDDVPGDP